MSKKNLSVFAALCVLLTATGCGSSEPAQTTPAETTTVAATADDGEYGCDDDDSDDCDDSGECDDSYESDESDEDEDDTSWLDDNDESGDSYGSYWSESGESSSQTSGGGFPYDPYLGTAKELDGNIAVVSVFVNTSYYPWDFDRLTESEAYGYYCQCLRVGTEYLEQECAKYGHHPKFIWDWEHYPLFYDPNLDLDPSDSNNLDYPAWDYIEKEVDTAGILEATDAQQIIYMFVFNTPLDFNVTSCTRNYYEGMEYPYEICYMFMGCDGAYESPSPTAHEILHTFGAPDLYMTDEEYGITQEYVDYATQNRINDIMRDTCDPNTGKSVYDSVKNEITDITAYYVGLTDYSETVEQWGFYPSQHASD